MACGPNTTTNTNIGGQPSRSMIPPSASVPIVDLKTGLVNPVWQQYFAGINLTQYLTGEGDDLTLGSGQTLSTDEGDISGTNTGDQNLFSTIAVTGQDNVVADSTTDTLTLAAGTNIALTTDATTDTVTVATDGLGTLATQSGTFSGTHSGTSSGTNTGDQNLFANIAVAGQDTVAADSTTDTLTLAAGTNITLTTTAASDTVTINSTSVSSNSFETIAVAGQDSVVADSGTDTLTIAAGINTAITTVAASDTITIGASLSCAFRAQTVSPQTVNTSNSPLTVAFATEIFDIGGDFDAAGTSIFTAPATGYYLFTISLKLTDITSGDDTISGDLISPGGDLNLYDFSDAFTALGSNTTFTTNGSSIVYLTSGQTAYVRISCDASGSYSATGSFSGVRLG